jgi:hypothetical protein
MRKGDPRKSKRPDSDESIPVMMPLRQFESALYPGCYKPAITVSPSGSEISIGHRETEAQQARKDPGRG